MSEERKERPTPKMIQIRGIGKNRIDDVKKLVPPYINVSHDDENVYVMTTFGTHQTRLENAFGKENVSIVDSIKEVYQNGFKIQSALNWRKFKGANADYTKEDGNNILIVVHSSPFDSNKEDTAIGFAKCAAKHYKSNYNNKLRFIIRGWQREWFLKAKKDGTLKDYDGKDILDFYFTINQYPIRRKTDRVITAKFIVPVKDVEGVIGDMVNGVTTYVCTFANPTIKKDKYYDRNKIDRRPNNNNNEERRPTDEGKKKPFLGKRYMRDVKRKDIRRKENDEINITTDNADNRRNTQTRIRVLLSRFPSNTAEKLRTALEKKLQDASFRNDNGDLIISVPSSKAKSVKETLRNVKINSTPIEFE